MLRHLAAAVVLMAAMTLGNPARAAERAAEHPAATAVESAGGHNEAAGAQGDASGAQAEAGEHGRQHQVIEFDATTAIWVLIIFVVLLIILYPTAWKNVLEGLKRREERIRKDIADAEAARAKAEETLKTYAAQLAKAEETVREMIARASADGEKAAAQIRARGQEEAEQAKERAVRDIDAARKQALTEIYEKTAELSTSIAAKILRRNINPDDQRDLVRESLQQMQETGSR